MAADDEWTSVHGRIVAGAAPGITEMSEADLDLTWRQVSAQMASTRPARKRRKIVMAGVSVVVAIGVGGTATATVLHSLLNPADDDFPQAVANLTSDIPFPSAQARAISNRVQIEEAPWDDAPVRIPTQGLRGVTADDAVCAWANAWAAAVTAGDAAVKQRATDALLGAASWPAVRALDVEFEFRTDQNGMPEPDNTRFGYLSLVWKAAPGDDLDAMGAALGTHVRCIPELVPDLPQAIPAELRP